MKIINLLLLLLVLFPSNAFAKTERDYQDEFCIDGVKEYILDDKTRVDCLTEDYAIEIDYAKKFYECIGQSIYYGLQTKRQPACALIVGENDEKYLKRLETVAKEYDIKIFVIKK